MAMRRSARETKKPEYYLGSQETIGKSSQSEYEEENRHGNKVSSDSEDHLSKRRKRDEAPPREEKKANKAASVPTSHGQKSTLFAKVATSSKYDDEVRAWISMYKSDRHAAMSTLLNFILMSAGSKHEYIEPDVDLEALETDEIQTLLSDMIVSLSSAAAKHYPLMEKAKGKGLTYRDRYQKFFASLVESLRFLPADKQKRGWTGPEVLRRIVEQLIVFSSLSVSNVRDAITEATLSISSALCNICGEIKKSKEVEERMVGVEKGKGGGGAGSKHAAHVKQRDELSKELETYTSVITMIFSAIYMHRSRDSHDEIRLTCVRHIHSLILYDISKPLKTEYLKYLGWACFDYAHSVRDEAVKAIRKLVQDSSLVPHLTSFVESFMARFIDIASADIEPSVSANMLSTLLVMQERGLLDKVAAEMLDKVDRVVFDGAAGVQVRCGALRFMMAHTEGFDDFDENEHAAALQASKKKTDNANQRLAIARRKNTALQLETLTEFAEYHLGSHVEHCWLLAEACLGTEKDHLLYEWSIIISLLTREGESLTTHPLRPAQVSILLRMLAFSAKHVYKQKQDQESQGSSKKAVVEDQIVGRYEALTTVLQSELPVLLSRFQDDKTNLTVLSELFVCCDMITNKQVAKNMVAKMSELFRSQIGEPLLMNICKAFGYFIKHHQSVASIAKDELRSVMGEVWTSVSAQLNVLNTLVTSENKRKRSSISPEDSMFTLASALEKLKVLWQAFDCRGYMGIEIDTFVSDLLELADLIPSVLARGGDIRESVSEQCVVSVRHIFMTLAVVLLWMQTDIITMGKEYAEIQEDDKNKKSKSGMGKRSRSDDGGGDDDEEEGEDQRLLRERVQAKVQNLVDIREKAVDAALTFIELEVEALPSARRLQLQGYQFISEMMTFFPARFNGFLGMEGLAFVPNQSTLNGLRKVFESEGSRMQRELEVLADDNNPQSASIVANKLIEEILLPLSQSMIFDVANVNRRQAAAVLYYLLVPNDDIQSLIKTIARKLKEGDMIKYLEIQLVALRGIYIEHVQKHIKARRAAEEMEDEAFDFIEADRAEQEGYEKLSQLAKKFASFFGVGRLKEEMLTVLTNFFREGVNFALSDAAAVGFVEALVPYLRFFAPAQRTVVLKMIQRNLEGNDRLGRELDEQRKSPHAEFSKLIGFIDQLEGRQSRGGERRLSGKSTAAESTRRNTMSTRAPEEEDEEVGDEDDFYKAPSAKKAAARSGRGVGKKRKEPPAALPPSQGARRSVRTVTKVASYKEATEEISDVEEEDEEMEEEDEDAFFESVGAGSKGVVKGARGSLGDRDVVPAAKKSRSSGGYGSRRTTGSSLPLGLDLEDIEEGDEEDREGAEVTPSPPNARGGRGVNRSFESLQLSPIAMNTSLDHIPSRRRSYQQM